MSNRKGWHHYPTVENAQYMSGTTDVYYDYQKYQQLKGIWLANNNKAAMHEMDTHFDRLQYVIYKDNEIPTEIILLNDEGLMLDWKSEIEKGLDHIVVSHRWIEPYTLDTAYRFSYMQLQPIGVIRWIAPDLFCWSKKETDTWKTLMISSN